MTINGYRRIVETYSNGKLRGCDLLSIHGLASRPGGVEILLAASSYKNRDKFRQL